MLSAISAHSASHDWVKIEHVVGDEPAGSGIGDSVAVARAFKQADASSTTAVFTSVPSLVDARAVLLDEVDMPILNHHSKAVVEYMHNRSQPFMLYNQGTRFRLGVYQFRLRQYGCLGHYQFAFSSVGADPYYGLDGREDDYCAVFSKSSGRELVSTLGFERAREGADDLR